MGWDFRRSGRARALDAVAGERLDRLVRQWRPISDGMDAPRRAPDVDDPDPPVGTRISVRPWTRSATRAVLLLLAACLALTAWWWWSGRPREVVAAPIVLATGQPIMVPASGDRPSGDPDSGDRAGSGVEQPGAAIVVVHVTGLVAEPGLVTLAVGSRVADAVAAAGGVTRRRAAESVNLARVLVDGEQIVVGGGPAGWQGGSAPATASSPAPNDLNSADGAALEGLPGVGPVLAGRIVEWRIANGPFRSVDELGEVSGIGDATLARLRALVRV